MYEQGNNRKPKASHYVSTHNGGVYPAQHGLPGYEDDNPADWRVATADEVAAYEQGTPLPLPASSDTVRLSDPAPVASPSVLKLADEPETTDSPTIENRGLIPPPAAVPADLADPPPAPPGIGLPPVPAFNPK